MSLKLFAALSSTSIDNSKIVSNGNRNNKNLTKFDFIKAVHRAEKSSFLAPNARQAFTQLRQVFIKVLIL